MAVKKECRFCGQGHRPDEALTREAHNTHTFKRMYGKGGPAPGETWVSHYHPTCKTNAAASGVDPTSHWDFREGGGREGEPAFKGHFDS